VRAAAAVDSGQAVNPDGIRNQIEGGILQSASWTLYKSVTFDLPLFGSDGPASRVEAKIKSDVGWHQAEFVAPDRSGAVRDRMCPITAKRLAAPDAVPFARAGGMKFGSCLESQGVWGSPPSPAP